MLRWLMAMPFGTPLVAAARAKGVFLMEAMWTRFLPHVAEIRRLLSEGALGDIVTVIADHGLRAQFDPAVVLAHADVMRTLPT